GYTDMEKVAIAKRHLIPKQLENHGLTKSHLSIDDSAIRAIIDGYTREAGLRNLEREIASLSRKVARRVASGSKRKITVTAKEIPKLLGPKKFVREALSRQGQFGVAPGLAYTAVGGELLFVEATAMTGKKELTLTGHLGDIMKESAQAALSFLRSNSDELKIAPDAFDNREIHIHVPSGATPKDGPSAGLTVVVALASLLTRRPVKSCLAMTGEITLRGQLLPVGGLKEKLLAAYRAGITTVILPKENRKDTVELPPEIKNNIKLKFFSEALSAVKFALEAVPKTRLTQARQTAKKVTA
ncbi:MAG: S16 family serine protease, partial [Candidatus Zixiibacteriota bacterium]